MVELVDGLEALGYAQRRRDPRDRRRYLLAVTEPGQAEQTALAGALGKLFATTPEGRRMMTRRELVRSEGK